MLMDVARLIGGDSHVGLLRIKKKREREKKIKLMPPVEPSNRTADQMTRGSLRVEKSEKMDVGGLCVPLCYISHLLLLPFVIHRL